MRRWLPEFPSDAELVSAAEVGRRLELSSERIRQLAKEGKLPPAVGRVGRNDVWRWDDIRIWAVATDRLSDMAGAPARRAPSIWLERPPATLRRTVDEVLESDDEVAHVRIWEPVSGRTSATPVVLLGNLDDNRGMSVTNRIEEVAALVQQRWLGRRGLDAEWFEYWPPSTWDDEQQFAAVSFEVVGPSSDRYRRGLRTELQRPQWYELSRVQLEALVGDAIEVYEPGTYTTLNVTEFAGGRRPVPMTWDPDGLALDVESVELLESAARASAQSGDLETAETLLFAAFLIADASGGKRERLRADIAADRRTAPVRKVPPDIGDRQWSVIDRVIENPDVVALGRMPSITRQALLSLRAWLREHDRVSSRRLVPGLIGLAWPGMFETASRRPGYAPDDDFEHADHIDEESRLASAARRAESVGTQWLRESDADFASIDIPVARPSAPLGASGAPAAAYLETVSWWGPRAQDRTRADQLDAELDSEELGGVAGYDPWGRLVRLSSSGERFVVEWPAIPPAEAPPDDSHIVGDEDLSGYHPVFIHLPDGRLDLLPMEPSEEYGPDFTWGYYGGGPHALAQALIYLCTGETDGRDEAAQVAPLPNEALLDLIASQGERLDIPLADVRSTISVPRRTEPG
jgi:hypothetical protein